MLRIEHRCRRRCAQPRRRHRGRRPCSPSPGTERNEMKIVVIGGTGLIGSKLVDKLREHGHERARGVARHGRQHAHRRGARRGARRRRRRRRRRRTRPRWDDAAVMDFFRPSTRNMLAAEEAAGVGHHVALSVVGADRLPDSGYLRAKVAQEELSRPAASRTRSSARRSSSSSSAASPTRAPTATRFAWRPSSSSPRRPTTSPPRWPTSP